jgi:xanthine phosphoribosyltransferase
VYVAGSSAIYSGELIVTWAEVHRDAKMLVRRLLPMAKWTGIVAISRGGLVPAAIFAREMEIRLVDTLCISTYEDKSRGDVKMLKIPEGAKACDGKGWLIVDDLVDTGVTMRAARALLPQAYVAAIYAKPSGIPTVDTFVHEVPQNTWIHFPWDTDVTVTPPLARA